MHYFFTFISLPEFPCATSLYDVKRTEREIALLAQAHKTVFGLKNHSRDSCTLVHSQLCLPKSTVYGVANSNDYKKLAFPSSHSRIWYKMLINWSFVFRCEECYAEDCVCHSLSPARPPPTAHAHTLPSLCHAPSSLPSCGVDSTCSLSPPLCLLYAPPCLSLPSESVAKATRCFLSTHHHS